VLAIVALWPLVSTAKTPRHKQQDVSKDRPNHAYRFDAIESIMLYLTDRQAAAFDPEPGCPAFLERRKDLIHVHGTLHRNWSDPTDVSEYYEVVYVELPEKFRRLAIYLDRECIWIDGNYQKYLDQQAERSKRRTRTTYTR
jgi:hypothetical protein